MFLSKPMLGTQIDWSNPLNNPVLDLLMNEGHGDVVHDLSGYGNHGTLHGFDFPPTRTSGWNPGMDGVGLNLDGSDDYIDCGNNASLDITGDITIDISAILNDVGERQGYLISKNDQAASDNQYAIFTQNGAAMYYGAGTPKTPTGVIPYGIQTDVIFTRTDGVGQFYINGVASGDPAACDMPSSPTFPVRLGCRWDADATPHFVLNGSIARARILPRAMSAFEVMQTQIDPYGVYQQ